MNQNSLKLSTGAGVAAHGIQLKRNATLKKSDKSLSKLELERVDEIVENWIDRQNIIEEIEAIAGESPEPMNHVRVQKSNFKPDVTFNKAARSRNKRLYHHHREAYEMIMLVPVQVRFYLTMWPSVKGKHNPITGKNFMVKDLYLAFECCKKTYETRVSLAKKLLISIDKDRNPSLYPKELRQKATAH